MLLLFCLKIFFFGMPLHTTQHTSTFLLWVDVILWSTLLILQKGADVPDPAWLPWGPPTLLEQMCSAIVNRHVCLSPSYYSRRMINRLITQKHQCKATEQWGISSNIYLNIALLQGALTKWRERGRRRRRREEEESSWKCLPTNPHLLSNMHKHTHSQLPGLLFSYFNLTPRPFHANSIILGSLCDFISLEIGNVL